jgi:hypothetical protein
MCVFSLIFLLPLCVRFATFLCWLLLLLLKGRETTLISFSLYDDAFSAAAAASFQSVIRLNGDTMTTEASFFAKSVCVCV